MIGGLPSAVLAGTSAGSARSEAVPPRRLCADSFVSDVHVLTRGLPHVANGRIGAARDQPVARRHPASVRAERRLNVSCRQRISVLLLEHSANGRRFVPVRLRARKRWVSFATELAR